MKNQEVKLEKFFTKQFKNTNTTNLMLLQLDDNNYILFGKYHIAKDADRYIVFIENIDKPKFFSALKIAVTWCVFNERRKIAECRQIEHIDFKLASLEVDIKQTTKILHSLTKNEAKFVYLSKLSEDDAKKKILLKQLNRFINMSKDWQTKKFNEAKSKDKR